ncbi:hypothetical protein ACFL59_10395 [Planctomycetota bacterium]
MTVLFRLLILGIGLYLAYRVAKGLASARALSNRLDLNPEARKNRIHIKEPPAQRPSRINLETESKRQHFDLN